MHIQQIDPIPFRPEQVRIERRRITIPRDKLAMMVRYYASSIVARPFADRSLIAFMSAVYTLKEPAEFFRTSHRGHPETGTYRQQAMAFTRAVSLLSAFDDYPPNSWNRIGRAFYCGRTLAIHAYHAYGDSMRDALEMVHD